MARISWWSLSLLTPVRVALSCPVACPGGVLLDTPLLMPMSGVLERNEEAAEFMDTSGGLVQLPFDLKVPFARYVCCALCLSFNPLNLPLPYSPPLFPFSRFVARTGVTDLRRFCFGDVYRGLRPGFQPRRLLVCHFDIITRASTALVPDAEVIKVATDIAEELLPHRQYFLRVSHAGLLNTVLRSVGLPHDQVGKGGGGEGM